MFERSDGGMCTFGVGKSEGFNNYSKESILSTYVAEWAHAPIGSNMESATKTIADTLQGIQKPLP